MPTKNAGNAVARIEPDPNHDIVLDEGVLSGPGINALREVFRGLEATHLSIFFHGGLVPEDAGLKTAHDLVKTFEDGGAYPFFFIWKSGLLDAIKGILKHRVEHKSFVAAANYAVKLLALKIAATVEGDPILKRQRLTARSLREAPMPLEELAAFAERFDRAWARHGGAQLGVTAGELDQFVEYVLAVQKGMAKPDRLFKTTHRVALRHGLGKVFQRLNSGHGHGVYTTVIEELLLAIRVGRAAAAIWTEMKDFIDWSFKNETTAGGTLFLDLLCAYWQRRPELRLTLIGHSAGAIYVQKFIEELDQRLQDAEKRVDVILMAAAITFERMHQGFEVLQRRVSGLRVFGLKLGVESGYFEFPGYKGSLLYFVSGVCEPDPNDDKALVGMRRYWMDEKPYKTPEIRAIAEFIGEGRKVLSPTDTKRPPPEGYRCGATQHGGFAEDSLMEGSMTYILQHGFTPT